MCRMQYILSLLAVHVGLAHSFPWDFAATSGSHLVFYFNGSIVYSESITSSRIELIIYDAVGNRVFFIDPKDKSTAIFSYDITTKKIESLVLKSDKRERILGIAFDPIEELLIWSELYSTRICWFSLKPGFKNNVYGNLLIEIEKQLTICALAVDSCKGYIYWTSTDMAQNKLPSTIERARFDGADREVLIGSNLQMPSRLVLDQQTQKLYWIEGTSPLNHLPADEKHFFIKSADLNGKNRTILYTETEVDQPMILAVSKDSLYWVHFFQTTINQLPKNPSKNANPTQLSISSWYEIATNYKIEDQIEGIQGCQALKNLIPTNRVTVKNVSSNISSDVSLVGVYGIKVSEESRCECRHGYTGERCEVSVCQNYCFEGDCIVSAEEQPTCRCNAGYSGKRCEVNVCQGYCLNDGICSLNEESQPVCQCKGYYEGERCDVSTCLNKCFQKVVLMVWGIINADVTQTAQNKGVNTTCTSTAV